MGFDGGVMRAIWGHLWGKHGETTGVILVMLSYLFRSKSHSQVSLVEALQYKCGLPRNLFDTIKSQTVSLKKLL